MSKNTANIKLEVARVLIEHSTKGYGDCIDFDVITAALPNDSRSDIEQSCFDFEFQGFLKINRALSKPILDIRLYPSFYAKFDPLFRDNDPETDAITVVQELLAQQAKTISAEELEAQLGWNDRRRFNSAFSLVVENLPANLKGSEINSDYPTKYILLTPEVRSYLKPFINEYP